MPKVIFISTGFVNGEEYKEGDELQVSPSIADDLIHIQKCAEEVKTSTKKKSDKK